jgi:hypothetical protein
MKSYSPSSLKSTIQVLLVVVALTAGTPSLCAQHEGHTDAVELQPFASQAGRVVEALDFLGVPILASDKEALKKAVALNNVAGIKDIENILDKYCLFDVNINPEQRVKVSQGVAKPQLVQNGWSVFLVKVHNEAGITATLVSESPNALPTNRRSHRANTWDIAHRPPNLIKPHDIANRWMEIAMFDKQPMIPTLSGLGIEYRIVQIYSRDAGKREGIIAFNVGQGTQDIGFRNNAAVLFNSRPAVDVKLRVFDEAGKPTTGSFLIRDRVGHIYPAQSKRLAPDLPFQPQVYRADGETVRLPKGEYQIEYWRGPEYVKKAKTVSVTDAKDQTLEFRLERWVNPAQFGWYSGDHHIHAAGCSHYEDPTQGVLPNDMIRQIIGEALNVGSVLTWGPCNYYQKQFFEAKVNSLSTKENLMRYDVEVSGFPSSHSGHIILLRLKDQDYPGTKEIKDWPTWDLPILKWAKAQNAVVGFAHSGWGLNVTTDKLPNYEMPKFDGSGANEFVVDVTHDVVDFISTVDTPSVWELNIWYHALNAGFRTRISGETDFPCIYDSRIGLGRSYVKLDSKLTFDSWVEGIKNGRSYVSDGTSHLMDFSVNGLSVGTKGSEVKLGEKGAVRVTANVAALLDETPNEEIRKLNYAVKPYWHIERARARNTREVPVEVIVNGFSVARKNILADGTLQQVSFDVPIEQSSWVALRILPSSHTNPIFITVGGKPIRASRKSAEWLSKAVDQCWLQKKRRISAAEQPEAEKAYDHARKVYQRLVEESHLER